jgi:hypothetical protein
MEEPVRLILTAGALALGLTACSSTSHPAPLQTTSATGGSPTATTAVSPTSRASRATADAVPSPKPVTDWCRGTGYKEWKLVTKDQAALQTDSASGAVSATKLALEGRKLASNATAAASSPPPGVSAVAYKKGMKDLVVSGQDDERDEIARATTITAEADAYLDNINSFVSVKCP